MTEAAFVRKKQLLKTDTVATTVEERDYAHARIQEFDALACPLDAFHHVFLFGDFGAKIDLRGLSADACVDTSASQELEQGAVAAAAAAAARGRGDKHFQ
mmetsp:Transcript_68993/g.135584  ORF Transcript_68993/g.135584 Transcript_68993/m.135584 type:complete len:100 (-) Transcript_68993:595-894(-)